LFATLKEVLFDNDVWFQNTRHIAVLKGYNAAPKKERNAKIALQFQSELTSTNEILNPLTLFLSQAMETTFH
jgi:hypothetical protein